MQRTPPGTQLTYRGCQRPAPSHPHTLTSQSRFPLTDVERTNALDLTLDNGIQTFVKALLDHGFDINFPHTSGLTPLHLAASNSYTALIRLLLDLGADPNFLSPGGERASDLALQSGSEACVAALPQRGTRRNCASLCPAV